MVSCSKLRSALVLGILFLGWGSRGALHAEQAAAAETQKVKIGKGTLEVPATWKSEPSTSRMRVAQFTLPKGDNAEGAELVVFYFGGGATGGVQANLDRWEQQFHAEKRTVKTVQGTCRDGSYVLSDITGTWKKPDGPPFAQKSIDKPGSRVVSIVWMIGQGESTDHYFLKLSGPEAAVTPQIETLRKAIGINMDSEKPYEQAK